jgi:PAS domain S-box-containing protein
MAEELLVERRYMPSPTAADVSGISGRKQGFYRCLFRWFVSPDHFHFGLLAGTVVSALVFVAFAVTFALVALRNQKHEEQRAHSVEIVRLASVVENDVSVFENAYRARLLTRSRDYMAGFDQLGENFLKHCDQLRSVLGADTAQQERILQMRENVQSWFAHSLLSLASARQSTGNQTEMKVALKVPALDQAHDVLQTILGEEQVRLRQAMGKQERVIQSIQILSFIPEMERAASDMQKEKRGYVLSGDPAFIDSYNRATADFYIFESCLFVLVANDPAQVVQLKGIRDELEKWIAQSAVPDIKAKGHSEVLSGLALEGRDEALMDNVRHALRQFEEEQYDVYQVRLTDARGARSKTLHGLDLFCALAAGLMIASGGYTFVPYRRQLKGLKVANARIQSVVDHIIEGMVTIDEKGAVCSMNAAARRMFGYEGDESLWIEFSALIPKRFERTLEDEPLICDWSYLAGHIGTTTLALARTRSNDTFPVEVFLVKMTGDEQGLHVAVIRDLRERKRLDEEVAVEKKSFAGTLTSIDDGVITTDLEGRVVICNPAAEALVGWKTSEAVGQPLRSVFAISVDGAPAQERNGSTEHLSEAETILLSTPERATLTARDGSRHLLQQLVSPIRDEKDEICGVIVVFRDITQRPHRDGERHRGGALDQLGFLAGGIAHDFNNLLTAVIGNISLVTNRLPPDHNMKRRLDDARNASLRARDLAQQLLTFARCGTPIKTPASITNLIQETASLSLRGAQSRSKLTIEPDLWTAEFDPGQISQVIANLVVNADQAMPNGGTLYLSCDNFAHRATRNSVVLDLPSGDYIRIRIRDEGVGIAKECMERIFEPYFTTKAKGNGLGLATSYSVIKNHGGLITMESELHRGSTFTIYLPATRHRPNAVAPVDKTNEPTNGFGRVLVVDDEEAICMLAEFTLTRLGYEVCAAVTATRAIELYREALIAGRRFDLVILDLTLPGGMGGKEVLRELIEIDPTVNAAVSSGYATDATMKRYEDFGFRGVIAKPYEASELGRKVQAMIGPNRSDGTAVPELQHAC